MQIVGARLKKGSIVVTKRSIQCIFWDQAPPQTVRHSISTYLIDNSTEIHTRGLIEDRNIAARGEENYVSNNIGALR